MVNRNRGKHSASPRSSVYQTTAQPKIRPLIVLQTGEILTLDLKPVAVYEDPSTGYLSVSIDGRHVKVHRAVALRWLPPPLPDQVDVAHIDGNPHNNDVSNLRWSTKADNAADRKRHLAQYGMPALKYWAKVRASQDAAKNREATD